MKNLVLTILFGGLVASGFAQTNVIKMSAVKSNNYGVEYYLPKTVLKIDVDYSKVVKKAGIYSMYAEKYLGTKEKDIVMEDQTYYILDKVSVDSEGVPDKNEAYLVEFKSKTTAPFVYLTQDGLICSVNAEYKAPELAKPTIEATKSDRPTVNVQSLFSEEYLRAGSVSKMAEVLAKQIYKIRESRTDILTGEAENTPKDGEAMRIVLSNLEVQEKALTELFTGTTSKESLSASFELSPETEMEKQVLFRFSKYLGIVGSDDLSGSPVYINLKNLDTVAQAPVDPKAKEKDPKSIMYNVPGKASIEIFYGTTSLYKGDLLTTQFGNKQVLATSIFEDKKAPVQILFYPETGAIKQIIQ